MLVNPLIRLSLVRGLPRKREEEEEEEEEEVQEDQEDEVNIGYGFFHVCLYWTGFGFQANMVEEHLSFSVSYDSLSCFFCQSTEALEEVSISTPFSGHYSSEPLVSGRHFFPQVWVRLVSLTSIFAGFF